MTRTITALALATVAAATPLSARTSYAAYTGVHAVREGSGGSSTRKEGIDWWTRGAPARRFQLLGLLTDQRDGLVLSGHAIGSPAIAKQVIRSGGDAVIVLRQSARPEKLLNDMTMTTVYMRGNGALARASGNRTELTTTRMAIIRYL